MGLEMHRESVDAGLVARFGEPTAAGPSADQTRSQVLGHAVVKLARLGIALNSDMGRQDVLPGRDTALSESAALGACFGQLPHAPDVRPPAPVHRHRPWPDPANRVFGRGSVDDLRRGARECGRHVGDEVFGRQQGSDGHDVQKGVLVSLPDGNLCNLSLSFFFEACSQPAAGQISIWGAL